MPSRHVFRKPLRWSDLWLRDRDRDNPTPQAAAPVATAPLKHVVAKMPLLRSLSSPTGRDREHRRRLSASLAGNGCRGGVNGVAAAPVGPDLTALLSDELLLRVLSLLPSSSHSSFSLVCKRWLRLFGRLRRSLTVLQWPFLTGNLPSRFPALEDLDLLPGSVLPPPGPSPVLLTRGPLSIPLDPALGPEETGGFLGDCRFIRQEDADRGLVIVSKAFPGLRRLSFVAVASELAVMHLADSCGTLQELELHRCSDASLRPISAFSNLQILRLVGLVDGFYGGPGVTDIGLTILAHGCKRLVKLELSGCEGSYDGVSAIGRCCLMLEELTISDHRMDAGWMAGLSYCSNLKTLKLLSCRRIDEDPGPTEHLGSCPTIERVHFQRCQLRDRRSLSALFFICDSVKDLVFQDCWGLENDMFGLASNCRRVKQLRLEGCSQLSTEGLESVILSWKDLQSLSVVSCNKIKDSEVSPALSSLFTLLKELKWRPDSRSLMLASLKGTGIGRKGGRFLKGRKE